jgi:transposase-like protein
MINPVNLPINRFFTKDEKQKILKLYYEDKLDYIDIANRLESLPNHIYWIIMRWKYVRYEERV